MFRSSHKHRRSSDIPEQKEAELREIARARLGLGDRPEMRAAPAPTDDDRRRPSGERPASTKKS